MLARLQQATTIGLLLAALAWGVIFWREGRPGLAAAGALLIVLGYALVLGIEFLLLARAHRDDPAPRAGARHLLAAWWGEVKTAPLVFCWRQPFRSRRWPDHLPADAQGRRGLLLVHGFVCNRGLWNRWMERLRERNVPHVALDLEPVFGGIDDYVARVEEGVRRLEQATGRPPVVVAHSMGGLAVRRWAAEGGNLARVHHVVTIGSPHQGTWLGRFAFSRNGAQMRLGSSWLATLAHRERGYANFTCFYSHCDNIVFPPSTATLPGADNRHLEGAAHVHLVELEAPFDEALHRVNEP